MRAKPLMLLAVALCCATVAAFAANQSSGQKEMVETPTEEILVAIRDVGINTKVTTERFKLEKWPRDRLPTGAIRDFKSVEGKYVNQRLYQGEPLLERKINNSRESVAVPAGSKVFDLPVDEKSGGGGYIKPGDRVDIHGFFEKTGKLTESKSVQVMENVEVLMVDGNAIRDQEDGPAKRATTIQLLVRSSQYEALNTAANLGRLRISLRPPEENVDTSKMDNGENFLAWVKSSIGEEKKPADTFAPLPVFDPAVQPKAHQMLIILPNGTEVYDIPEDGALPKKVTNDLSDNSGASNQLVSGVNSASYPTTQSQSAGMVWNGSQWVLGTTGLKPQYPTADDGKKKKTGYPGNSGKSENAGAGEVDDVKGLTGLLDY